MIKNLWRVIRFVIYGFIRFVMFCVLPGVLTVNLGILLNSPEFVRVFSTLFYLTGITYGLWAWLDIRWYLLENLSTRHYQYISYSWWGWIFKGKKISEPIINLPMQNILPFWMSWVLSCILTYLSYSTFILALLTGDITHDHFKKGPHEFMGLRFTVALDPVYGFFRRIELVSDHFTEEEMLIVGELIDMDADDGVFTEKEVIEHISKMKIAHRKNDAGGTDFYTMRPSYPSTFERLWTSLFVICSALGVITIVANIGRTGRTHPSLHYQVDVDL